MTGRVANLLPEGLGLAVDLLPGPQPAEVMAVRRMLEPAATGAAAAQITAEAPAELQPAGVGRLESSSRTVFSASGRTVRALAWPGSGFPICPSL